MNVVITLHDEFKRQFKCLRKKYRSLTDDLEIFQKELMENPFQGDSLGGGVRKVRMAISSKGKGKSGGARVLTLTVLVSENADVTLLTIYDKEEIDNVSDEYIKWLVSKERK
ncbi:MAG: type II toxin-antitoxin system RelE/ParE family toxin [Prevotella sp.]|nr:type II toxin-antitoxin system RelE/ParE family toxin [Prevotella sp.]